MERSTPPLTIGLPVYNGQQYLAGTLDGLLAQDYADFELVICNNASTDATEEICLDYAGRDSRIRYHRNPTNIGATPNWNRVLELARGEFFKWAMHDDECAPSMVRKCMDAFASAPPSTALIFPKSDIIDGAGRVKYPSPDKIDSSSDKAHLRLKRVLWGVGYANALWGITKTEKLRRARPAGCIEADLVLLAELSLQGKLIEIPETLYRMRRHEGNATEINKTARDLMSWYNPLKAKDRIFLPHWDRVTLEYLRAVRHAPLTQGEKWACYATTVSVCYWRRFLRWTGPLRKRFGLSRQGRALTPAFR